MGKGERQKRITETQRKVEAAAKDLGFLKAARYRDELVQSKEEKVAERFLENLSFLLLTRAEY